MFSKAWRASERGTAPPKAEAKPCTGCLGSEEWPYPWGELPLVRNLVYHVAPFSGNGTWQRCVEQINRRISMFNGKRVVAIVTGPELDSPDDVKRAFGDADYIVLPNRPTLREVETFLPLFERAQSMAPNECTFYVHAKGVTRPVNDGVTVHRWADIMLETCLDYWPLVEDYLLDHPCAGSFKKIGMGFSGSVSTWHYSGSFFWLRNAAFFNREKWRQIDRQWWGIEAWPSLHVKASEAATIFHTAPVPAMDLYDLKYFNETVQPDYDRWRERNKVYQRVFA